MKKILFVTNHFRYSNGVATVLKNLIINLDSEKYNIHLLVLYEFDKEFAKPIIEKTTILKGFGFYFKGFDRLINRIPPNLLYKYFIKEDYDTEIAFQFGVPTKMISTSKNDNKICWMHGFDSKMVLRKYYERYPKIINVSKSGRDSLVQMGFDQKICDYAYNIIDEKKIIELSEEKCTFKKEKKIAVITIGRLAPDKGFMRYLESVREIIKTIKNVEFWIVGGGTDEKRLKNFVQENQLEEYIKFFGAQKNPYSILSQADLYFCSSYREGFSTTCQEAAILGIPVVSVEVNGAYELINLSNSGSVIANDKESIINNLTQVLSNKNQINLWKINSYENRTEFYTMNRLKKIESILES